MTQNNHRRSLISLLVILSLISGIFPDLANAKGSGGYGSFRASPSVSVSRTPSVVPRSAPTSGGYGSYRSTPTVTTPTRRPTVTDSDRTISRDTSSSALRDMRRQDRPTPTVARPSTSTGYASAPGGSGRYIDPRDQDVLFRNGRTPRTVETPTWQRQQDWTIPSYAQPRQSYGDWNPLLMWFLIANLNRPGHSEFFQNHRNDPGYRQWREEADRKAASNPELKSQLDSLDDALDKTKSAPQDTTYLPAGIDPAIAHATQPQRSSGGGGIILLLAILALIGFGIYLAAPILAKRRKAHKPMSKLSTLVDLAKRQVTTPNDAPIERFKIGQAISIERTPFLLATESKVTPPETRSGATNITRIGKLSGAAGLIRLYLDATNFLQVSLTVDGTVADCRYFSRIDEIYPQSADEWRVWIDKRGRWQDLELGILADPKFRTPDDVLYDRVWTPGDNRVPPREMRETVQTLEGQDAIDITAQLYARAMPGAENKQEYLLAEVRENLGTGDRNTPAGASVIIYAGLDLPPSSLGL